MIVSGFLLSQYRSVHITIVVWYLTAIGSGIGIRLWDLHTFCTGDQWDAELPDVRCPSNEKTTWSSVPTSLLAWLWYIICIMMDRVLQFWSNLVGRINSSMFSLKFFQWQRDGQTPVEPFLTMETLGWRLWTIAARLLLQILWLEPIYDPYAQSLGDFSSWAHDARHVVAESSDSMWLTAANLNINVVATLAVGGFFTIHQFLSSTIQANQSFP